MKIKLPKPYLSWSAISLWNRDKDLFRRRYYENEKSPDNVFTLFGRETHTMLETQENLAHIPRHEIAELEIKTEIEGVPILGYIDNFSPKTKAFLDYKTAKNPWTEVEVQKLDQMPFYSLLIKEKFGKVKAKCQLIWLETRFKEVEEKVGSQIMVGEGNELELTGVFKVFNRTIEEWERERIKKWIVKSAKEISEDYQNYLLKNESL